MLRTE